MSLGQKPNPLNQSASPALEIGTLKNLAKSANETTVIKMMYSDLKKAKVGTNKIEAEAFDLLMEMKRGVIKGAGSKMGKSKKRNIIKFRDAGVVCDLIDVKLRIIEKEEKGIKLEYRLVKERVRRYLKERGKDKKF